MSEMFKIIFLTILLLILIGLINRRILRMAAIAIVIFLLYREITHYLGYQPLLFKKTMVFVADVGDFKFIKKESFDFDASSKSDFKITSGGGQIDIEPWPQNKIHVVVTKRVAEEKYLKDLKINTKSDGDSVYMSDVDFVSKDLFSSFWGKSQVRVDYKIKVPKNILSLSVQSSGKINVSNVKADTFSINNCGGRTKLSNLTGTVNLSCASGQLDVKNVTGNMNAKLKSGQIHCVDMNGSVDIEVTSGSVFVKNVSGPVDIRSNSGEVQVVGAQDKANVKVISGKVFLGDMKGPIDINIVSGKATLKNIFSSVNAHATSGMIDITVANGTTGKIKGTALSGKIVLRNYKGEIMASGRSVEMDL